jgi:hypothetical protein
MIFKATFSQQTWNVIFPYTILEKGSSLEPISVIYDHFKN